MAHGTNGWREYVILAEARITRGEELHEDAAVIKEGMDIRFRLQACSIESAVRAAVRKVGTKKWRKENGFRGWRVVNVHEATPSVVVALT